LTIDELYKKAKTGPKSSEEQLYARLLESFRAIVQQHIWNDLDREEVAQDALLVVIAKYKEIKIESSFAAWALKVLHNKILDYVKIKQIRNRKLEELGQEQNPQSAPPSNPLLKARIKKCFAEIHKSHKKHARILNLSFQGYTTDEICEKLNISRNSYYVSLSRGRSMLQACLNQEDQDL